ncbi:hypothetical protein MNBD_GAMMA15-4 [hydrothermal vent metagenome]|uniref:Hemerythrin-like domain-containing protein n=1 Tax=hydrothermal vent metagenome TaxID=652676 RepID=A0A3B0YAH3_9ZZZZ
MEDFLTGCEGWLTGIEILDAQHVELAACIGEVADACHSAKKKPGLLDMVNNLYRRTKKHFEYEEAVMREVGYPEFSAHQREHIMLLAELKLAINRGGGADEIIMNSEMVRELKVWFMAHIKHSDCRFSAYISHRKLASKINLISPKKTLDL